MMGRPPSEVVAASLERAEIRQSSEVALIHGDHCDAGTTCARGDQGIVGQPSLSDRS